MPRLPPGTHTLVVRVDWRDPGAQSEQGFHRTWFNWGGLNGQVTMRPLGESELLRTDDPDDARPDAPGAARRACTIGVHVRNNGPHAARSRRRAR